MWFRFYSVFLMRTRSWQPSDHLHCWKNTKTGSSLQHIIRHARPCLCHNYWMPVCCFLQTSHLALMPPAASASGWYLQSPPRESAADIPSRKQPLRTVGHSLLRHRLLRIQFSFPRIAFQLLKSCRLRLSSRHRNPSLLQISVSKKDLRRDPFSQKVPI